MKTKHLLVALTVLLLTTILYAANRTGGQFCVVNTSTTVPKQLTNTTMYVRSVTFIGKPSNQGSANAGSVYIGFSSADGGNLYEITSGSVHTFTPPPGDSLNLAELYIDVASANDGLAIIWE